MSSLLTKIENEIASLVKEFGCSIVRVCLLQHEKRRILQIMIEKIDGSLVAIEDCENVSRVVSVCLDVLDPIKGNYNLEISSAGLDRPLTKPADFMKFVGKDIVVKTYVLKNDRKIFKGVLESASENGINLKLDLPLKDGGSVVDFIYSEIKYSHIDGFKTVK